MDITKGVIITFNYLLFLLNLTHVPHPYQIRNANNNNVLISLVNNNNCVKVEKNGTHGNKNKYETLFPIIVCSLRTSLYRLFVLCQVLNQCRKDSIP